jgi:hypothetical protein
MNRLISLLPVLAFANIIDACCCMVAMPNARVEFTGQSNIIVWDDRNHLEHFIRSAKFSSSAKEYDLVAPTPSVPEVSVAKQAAFAYLRQLTMPAPPQGGNLRSAGAAGGGGFGSGSVQVYQETEVGNFHVVTLKATDTVALKKWFDENHYQVSATQDEWFSHYIKQNWYLTAFRVITKDRDVKTEAIRMSFETKVPYNPYYVPKENWSRGAQLELFLIAPYAMQGVVDHQLWAGVPQGSAKLPVNVYPTLAKNLGIEEGDIPSNMTVYRYLDYKFAWGAMDDLFFYPKK